MIVTMTRDAKAKVWKIQNYISFMGMELSLFIQRTAGYAHNYEMGNKILPGIKFGNEQWNVDKPSDR